MASFSYVTPSAFAVRADRGVGLWLLGVAAMIFAMSVIGAITRLTESGLSIMEWAPISGALPPLSGAEWERLFALYKETAEYRYMNPGMTLSEFREIFWWEWVHRLWGRLIGVAFLVPFVIFLVRGRIRADMRGHLVAIFLLGALQGGIGWFMVASGFSELTDVSHYRLTVHLSLALIIYAYCIWAALRFLLPQPETSPQGQRLRIGVIGLLGLLAVTLVSGALVAGLNAGFLYNTFPLMGDRLVPPDYAVLEPAHVNILENPAAVQFNHRLLAIATVVTAIGLWLISRRAELSGLASGGFTILMLVALLQLGLGIATLLMVVPVWLGALHQAGALLLLTACVWALYVLQPEAGEADR